MEAGGGRIGQWADLAVGPMGRIGAVGNRCGLGRSGAFGKGCVREAQKACYRGKKMWTAQVLLTGEQQGLGLGMKSTQIGGPPQPPISLRVS